ncbi:MAG TPA: PilN domain-containing protein [Phycisphaerales bacterium]|nr:PilN domain-containing protein [Phycisphaerales bacterium]
MSRAPVVNLLPAPRAAALRRRAMVRWWLVGLGVYALAAAGLGVGAKVSLAADDGVHEELSRSDAELKSRTAEEESLRKQLDAVRRRHDAAMSVGHHPDWSGLLALLARSRGEGIVLDGVTMSLETRAPAPTPGAAKPPAAPRARVFKVHVRGAALHVRSANEFVLALEDSGLFDSVRLAETVSDAAGSRTRFEVVAELIERREGSR